MKNIHAKTLRIWFLESKQKFSIFLKYKRLTLYNTNNSNSILLINFKFLSFVLTPFIDFQLSKNILYHHSSIF